MSSEQAEHEATHNECDTHTAAADTEPQLISVLTAMQATMDRQNMFLERIFNEKQAAEKRPRAIDHVDLQFLKTKNSDTWCTYKKWRNRTVHIIKKSKEDYYKNLLTDNVHNPRQLWKILKDILPTNDTVSQITLNINGKEISDPIEVGDLFNEYFSSIANNFDISLLNNPINTHLPIATNHIKFTIPLITIDDILNLAAELDQNKSTGLDGIPAYFIKSSIHSIAPIILRICNMSIENGVFPNMWKKARLIPIYKAESRTERNNYRPISILPILSKLLERHVANSYVKFLTENDILSSCQHGFRAHHSCESTLILICEHLLDNIEQGLINGIALIDLSKAFDLVDHRLLLQKLEQYGITPIPLKWFKSYLNDRYQVVQIASSLSNPALIKSGVPQGSILGPILFLIFINDLPSYVGSSKPFLFADDSTLISSGSDLHELSVSLKSDMTSVSRWTNHNKLSLNHGKTKIMKIYSQSKFPDLSPITIEVNNNNVKEITSAILLGVTLDQHLKWDRQINTIYNIINSRLYLLKHIRSYLTFQSRIQLYYALIYPHLLYCSTVWGNANNDLITCLLKLQKRAARLILEQSTEVPSIVLFRKLNWIPIFNLIKMRKILLVFNTLKTSWPPDLRKLFVFVRDSHPIPTRSSITDLKVPSVKTTQAKSKISFSGASLFNSLPSELKDIENHSIYSYKKKLKTGYFIQLNYEVDHVNKFRCIDYEAENGEQSAPKRAKTAPKSGLDSDGNDRPCIAQQSSDHDTEVCEDPPEAEHDKHVDALCLFGGPEFADEIDDLDNDILLSNIALNLSSTEQTGPPISEHLAKIINSKLADELDITKLKEILSK
ncbi:Hypothetical predicted protein [Paramuricea clavata]|uniref:Uncharacterized protein n=1 Tax=Paramuricea clavata TaxID=317549 RepID=A0A6S7FZA0_PARCT|nr:Hypothetical predicted protein [Paramuricea clavata]